MKKAILPHLAGKAHVIWDWNGTLVDDVDVAVAAVGKLLGEHGLPQISRRDYLETFCFPITEYYRRIGFDFEKVPFSKLADRFIVNYEAVFPHCRLHAGAQETLADIKAEVEAEGYKLDKAIDALPRQHVVIFKKLTM